MTRLIGNLGTDHLSISRGTQRAIGIPLEVLVNCAPLRRRIDPPLSSQSRSTRLLGVFRVGANRDRTGDLLLATRFSRTGRPVGDSGRIAEVSCRARLRAPLALSRAC